MRNNFLITVITALALCWNTGLKAADIIVTNHVAGNLDTEISGQLSEGQMKTDITSLTVSGGNLDTDDAATIKTCTNLATLDVSGIAFTSSRTPKVTDDAGLANGLKKLKTVFLPNNLKILNNGAFNGCSELETVKIKNTDEIENLFFSVDNVELQEINQSAFKDCTKLQAGVLPPNVHTIRKNAFNASSSISITEFPVKLKIITDGVFRQCTNITELTIPAGETENVVIRIDPQALFLNSGTRTYTIRGKSPVLGTSASAGSYINPYAFSQASSNINLGTSIRILRILKKYANEYTRWTAEPSTDAATTGFGMTIEYLTQTIAVNIIGGDYGTVSYSGDGLVFAAEDNASTVEAYEGEDVTLTFAPKSGAGLSIAVDGEPVALEDNTYTLADVSQNGHTINVTFTEPPKTIWTGNGDDGYWTDSNNWSNGAPDTNIDVYIPASITSIPVIPDKTSVKTITFEQGAQADLEGTLTVTEAVNVKYRVTPDRWYSIGFPFEAEKVITVRSERFEREGWSSLLPYNEEGYGENYYGDYYLKEYNPTLQIPFLDVETIVSGKGYIIQFPDYFVDTEGNGGDIITFSSSSQTISVGNGLPVSENYQLAVNPSLKNITMEAQDGNKHYYYLEDDEYKLLKSDTKVLLPFEAAITIMTNQSENLALTIDVDNETITGTGKRLAISNGSVIATHHYTLQGIEIKQPVKNGIYIVKKRYSSGKESVEKIIYKQK